MMRLGQVYSALVYMNLKCLNDYDETKQAGPHTICMHGKLQFSAEFERLSFTKLCISGSQPF